METTLRILGHIYLERVNVWFQDEVKYSQQNITTQIWVTKGRQPRVIRLQQFEFSHRICVV